MIRPVTDLLRVGDDWQGVLLILCLLIGGYLLVSFLISEIPKILQNRTLRKREGKIAKKINVEAVAWWKIPIVIAIAVAVLLIVRDIYPDLKRERSEEQPRLWESA